MTVLRLVWVVGFAVRRDSRVGYGVPVTTALADTARAAGSGQGRPAGFAEEAAQLVASLAPGSGVDVAQVVFDGLGRDEQRSGYLDGSSPCMIR